MDEFLRTIQHSELLDFFTQAGINTMTALNDHLHVRTEQWWLQLRDRKGELGPTATITTFIEAALSYIEQVEKTWPAQVSDKSC